MPPLRTPPRHRKPLLGRILTFEPLRWLKPLLVDKLRLAACACAAASQTPGCGASCALCPSRPKTLHNRVADQLLAHKHPHGLSKSDPEHYVVHLGRSQAAAWVREELRDESWRGDVAWLRKHANLRVQVHENRRSLFRVEVEDA